MTGGDNSPKSEQEEGGDCGMRVDSMEEDEDIDSWISTLERLLKSRR